MADPRTRGKSTLKLLSHQIQAGKNIRGEITQDAIIEKKDSVLQHGQISPLKVYRQRGDEVYTLIDGETRWRGICLGIQSGELPEDFQIMALMADETSEIDIINTQLEVNKGHEIPILNVANSFRELKHFGYSEKQIADKHTRGNVQRVKEILELLNLTPDLQTKISKGEVAPTLVTQRLKGGKKSTEINAEINEAQRKTGKKKIMAKHLTAIPKVVQSDMTKEVSAAEQFRTYLSNFGERLVHANQVMDEFNKLFKK